MSVASLHSCALVITTYNWPTALNLVLQSVADQHVIPNQILIADDGSGEDTLQLVEKWKKKLPQIIHCWQEDIGFRAARSRNNAIARSVADYIIIIDGDMVLEPHFIYDHLKFSKQGSFVQGRRAILRPEPTEKLLKQSCWKWNFQQLKDDVRASHKLKRFPFLTKLLGYKQNNAVHVRSCNMAFWRKDLIAVNGFDSNFVGWGREDSDIGWRLINSGLSKRHLRYSGVALHLYHKEVSRESLPENEIRRKRAMTDKSYVYCENGLEQIPEF